MNYDEHKQRVAELAKAEIVELWEKIGKLNKQLDYQQRLLETHCQHVDVSIRSKYVEGGYDHVSQVHVTHTCNLCGKLLKSYADPHHRGTYA